MIEKIKTGKLATQKAAKVPAKKNQLGRTKENSFEGIPKGGKDKIKQNGNTEQTVKSSEDNSADNTNLEDRSTRGRSQEWGKLRKI